MKNINGAMRPYAIIAGSGYVLLFALAIFANFFVREGLVVAGNAAQTAENILESESLFRLGLFSFLIIFLVDVVVAWALYILFKSVNKELSLLGAWFRLVYTVFLGVALIFFFQALQFLSRPEFLNVFSADQLNAQALVALDSFNSTWLIGLCAFGVHLILVGALIIRSGWTFKALGYVVIVAGLSYIIDTAAHSLLTDYAAYEPVFIAMVAIPSIIAEGWFGLWLLLKGGKHQAMIRR